MRSTLLRTGSRSMARDEFFHTAALRLTSFETQIQFRVKKSETGLTASVLKKEEDKKTTRKRLKRTLLIGQDKTKMREYWRKFSFSKLRTTQK